MESEVTATFPVGGDDPMFTTGSTMNIQTLAQIPDYCNMEDLLPLDESAGHAPPDPQSAGDTSHSTTIPYLWSPLFGFNMEEINAALTSTAAVNDNILSVENPPREPTTPVVNVGLAMPGPDRDPYSTGVTSCPSASAAADTGSRSPDLEVNAAVGLPQSGGGGALTEAPVRASSKRKCLNSSSTEADLVRSDPSSAYVNYPTGIDYRGITRQERFTDIKPPDGSTPFDIIQFLKRACLAEQDQTAPEAHRRYVTNMPMMPGRNKRHHGAGGYWLEKADLEVVRKRGGSNSVWNYIVGIKRTFQFHTSNGKETNWFMDEYIPTDHWGMDLYFGGLRFREVFELAGKQRVNINNRIADVNHRKRGPDDPKVVKGESKAWQHFIKIYDRHPELEGSKVVYAVCCHCDGVLKAESHTLFFMHFERLHTSELFNGASVSIRATGYPRVYRDPGVTDNGKKINYELSRFVFEEVADLCTPGTRM
ncbi:unnamed protein product [Miscanthus lutarioriparius]|uniref:BED-type domain-containing protein n=1 Tax=Miscanthus lutarioriparius TaxID=422564 RepID=A0A811RBA8_9POAL|nr:unnamed protein product [Miscanthus lutarioriparius]